jgi:hypothetical protein
VDTIHEYHDILRECLDKDFNFNIEYKSMEEVTAEPAWTLRTLLAHFGKRFCTFEEFEDFLKSYAAMKKRVAERNRR